MKARPQKMRKNEDQILEMTFADSYDGSQKDQFWQKFLFRGRLLLV